MGFFKVKRVEDGEGVHRKLLTLYLIKHKDNKMKEANMKVDNQNNQLNPIHKSDEG